MQLLETATQRFDDWGERFSRALPLLLQRKREMLARQVAGLRPQVLLKDVMQYEQRLSELVERFSRVGLRVVGEKERMLRTTAQLLESYHYKKVLQRGFRWCVMKG